MLITFFEAVTIAAAFKLYFSINCAGVPDSPKVSFVPTNSCGTGLFVASALATLSPSPPIILCSSAVTTQPVLLTDFIINSSSRGLIVCMLITSAVIPCFSNSSAA